MKIWEPLGAQHRLTQRKLTLVCWVKSLLDGELLTTSEWENLTLGNLCRVVRVTFTPGPWCLLVLLIVA